MTMWAACYLKGRGGVTTTAVGMAMAVPAAVRPVVVECDPAGGDLMRRHRLAATPGLVGLATAARGEATSAKAMAGATQQLRVGDRTVDVVVAPCGGAQTRVALSVLARPGQVTLNPPDRLVIADCGRLDFASPARPLLAMADVVLVVACPRADELAHLRERLGDVLDVAEGRLAVVLSPGGVYGPAEVAEMVNAHLVRSLARGGDEVDVYGPLPDDRRAAAVLAGDLVAGRRWRRLPLMIALGVLAHGWAPSLPMAPYVPADPLPPRETSR